MGRMPDRLLRPEWLPPCAMSRVITHWTGGLYAPSSADRTHYHFLIDGQARVWVGVSVQANSQSARRRSPKAPYAAHTLNCNTGSIGVAVCAMFGAQEDPFDAGRSPMLERQWLAMAQVVAELCLAYQIPVTSKTVLGHGEVQDNLGIRQRGKWDPMVLPWAPEIGKNGVGGAFRLKVQQHLNELRKDEAEGREDRG